MAAPRIDGSESRSRPPPPPLRLHDSSFKSSTIVGNKEPLLYDLPSASGVTPPATTTLFLTSPTSPTGSFTPRSRGSAAARRTPPPPSSPGRPRSLTPQPGLDDDLEHFAGRCRAWYYNQDDAAGLEITKTLAKLPPSHRAQYARVQASIRAAYHASESSRKRAEFQAHLSATQCGGSLMPHSRANPGGEEARKERYGRLERFINSWCNVGMPGTTPFFQALWAVLRLQVIPEHLGGAGSRRIEWEFDDAVFMESAGKDFMLEAIDVLKGVLGFHEKKSPRRSHSFRLSKDAPPTLSHWRSVSEPLSNKPPVPPRRQKPVAISTTTTNRPRAPSDPFLDAPSRTRNFTAPIQTPEESASNEVNLTEETRFISPSTSGDDTGDDEYLRTWTSPELPNTELTRLISLFPPFLSRGQLPRFPVINTSRRPADLEEGGDDVLEDLRHEIRFGTGTIWAGTQERPDGWQGGWWERFVTWWRRLLC